MDKNPSFTDSVSSLSKRGESKSQGFDELEGTGHNGNEKVPQTGSNLNSKVIRECQSTCSEASLIEVSDDEDSQVSDSPKKLRSN